jgi:hypothetical protein
MSTTIKILSLSIALAIGALGAGCGKSDAATKQDGAKPGAAFAATCNKVKKTSKCDEYATLTMGIEEAACGELGGTFSATAACPTDARMGICKKASGTTYYYSSPGAEVTYTQELAKLDCENPLTEGRFTAVGTPPPAAPAAGNDTAAPSGAAQAAAPAKQPAAQAKAASKGHGKKGH